MDIEANNQKYCGSYQVLKTLGTGYHAKVKMAVDSNGNQYAIKVFKNTHALAANVKALANEINVMKELNHPNLVNLAEFSESMAYQVLIDHQKKNGQKEQRVCMVLELAQNGELFEYVAQTGRFREETCRFYFKQLMQSLYYLHSKGYAHRDLKPENVLFDKDFNLKIADFGFATLLDKYGDGKLKTILGTEGYMAPELNAKQSYKGEQVDLFASSVILFIMYAGSPPFSRAAPNDPYYKLIMRQKEDTFWSFHAKHKKNPDFFSPDLKDMLTKMFQADPSKRLTLEQVLAHPWMQGQTNSLQEIQNEFNKRKNIVDGEFEKERQRRQAEKQKQQQSGAMFTGVGKFRSLEDLKLDFTPVEQEYNLKSEARKIQVYDAKNGRTNDFFTAIDENGLIRYLLLEYQKYCSEVTKVSDSKFKFEARNIDDGGDVVVFTVELKKNDEDVNVEFMKKEGDSLAYHQKVEQIKNMIRDLAK